MPDGNPRLTHSCPFSVPVEAATVTLQVAVLFPSSVVTVMVAVPSETAVTRPDEETVATDVKLDFQLTFLFVALEGLTVAVSCPVWPFDRDISVLFSETPVTEITFFFTVTTQEAVLFPSSVVAVIVAVPPETAVTKPLEETFAIDVELDLQLTFLFVALEGLTVAVSCPVSPSVRVISDLSSEIPDTGLLTVTAQEAV